LKTASGSWKINKPRRDLAWAAFKLALFLEKVTPFFYQIGRKSWTKLLILPRLKVGGNCSPSVPRLGRHTGRRVQEFFDFNRRLALEVR
jgi:hypothetical protein